MLRASSDTGLGGKVSEDSHDSILPPQSTSTPAGFLPLLTSTSESGPNRSVTSPPLCALQCYMQRLSPGLPGALEADTDAGKLESALEALVHEAPIVQFSSFLYYCYENEPEMVIEVMRIGSLAGSSSMSFITKEASAKPGTTYEHREGMLNFGPGEDVAEIRIPLIMCDTWDSTLEFRVELGASGMTNCILGRYLWFARVKVMKVRGDAFPSDRYSVNIMRKTLHEVPKPILFLEYCKTNLLIPKVRIGTRLMVLVGLLRNIHFISFLAMAVYTGLQIVDDSPTGKGFKYTEDELLLWILSAVAFLPTVLFAIIEYRLIDRKVDGTVLSYLQRNVIQRFLNFTEAFRHNLRDGDLLISCCEDAEVLVRHGFMNVMPLIQAICKLILLALFPVLMPVACGEDIRPEVVAPILSLPLVFISFLALTHRYTAHFLLKLSTSQVELGQTVDDTHSNYYLIADYNQRPFFVDRNEYYMANYNKSRCHVDQIMKINEYFLPSLSILMLSVYIPFGGKQVIDNKLRVVLFLSDIFVVISVGHICSEIHCKWMDIQKAFHALERLVIFLNGKIDVPQRMQINRRRRVITKDLRARVRRELTEGRSYNNRGSILSSAMENQCSHQTSEGAKHSVPNLLPVDLLPIRLSNIDLNSSKDMAMGRVRSNGNQETLIVPFKYEFTLDITQGQMVVLTGPPGEGKASLLKVIGDTSVQDGGTDVFVPSHLRILHICSDALFFHGTLYANLTFGVCNDHPFTFYADGRRERVMDICQRIGLPEQVLRLIRQDVESRWNEVLSATHRNLLNIARALIANPEILCIHEPADLFDHETSQMVLQLLKEFVTMKGIAQENTSLHLRRPRTCIMTSNKKESAVWADQVFYVSRHGIRKLSVDENGEMPDMNAIKWPIEDSHKLTPEVRPCSPDKSLFQSLYTSEGNDVTAQAQEIISGETSEDKLGLQPLDTTYQSMDSDTKALPIVSSPTLESKATFAIKNTVTSEDSTRFVVLHETVVGSKEEKEKQSPQDPVHMATGFESQDTDAEKTQ